jgi:molybdopterin synthase sulfur carrier subunit
VRVFVKLFATLGRHFAGMMPGTPAQVEVLEGATLADLADQLQVPQEEVKMIFVNGRIQPLAYELQPGDEVGIFPPVGGG